MSITAIYLEAMASEAASQMLRDNPNSKIALKLVEDAKKDTKRTLKSKGKPPTL